MAAPHTVVHNSIRHRTSDIRARPQSRATLGLSVFVSFSLSYSFAFHLSAPGEHIDFDDSAHTESFVHMSAVDTDGPFYG